MMGRRGFIPHDFHLGVAYHNNIWSSLIMLGVAILIGVLIVWIVKKAKNSNNRVLEELKIKYVKEEISEEDYLRKKEVILRK
ncbi:MAG: SHOCT domain-containing protein [Eubacteriaceae bacterium]